jgi:hypothetical protein
MPSAPTICGVRLPGWSATLNAVIAVFGVVLLVVAVSNFDYGVCQPGEPAFAGVNADDSGYSSCGGVNPVPYLVGGLILLCVAGALAARSWSRHRRSPAH